MCCVILWMFPRRMTTYCGKVGRSYPSPSESKHHKSSPSSSYCRCAAITVRTGGWCTWKAQVLGTCWTTWLGKSYCGWGNPASPQGWVKPQKWWDKPRINWCRFFSIRSISCSNPLRRPSMLQLLQHPIPDWSQNGHLQGFRCQAVTWGFSSVARQLHICQWWQCKMTDF